ncbi:MAG TPA: pyridoxamine 5'-phosphate oxidase family protein [Ilumatobacteraceae bacterium]|nr:pyridoxamine 5'-phosphate oxidase family protein [Ilumatobacteraceae bacterium]
MASKRSQITMTDEEVQSYLETERVLNVATIGPTGHPHLVAMWFAMVGGNAVFWTFGKSQKVLNLRRNSKMSGLVESGDSYDQLRGVELRGRGTVVEEYDDVLEIGKAVGVKYNGPAALGDAALPFLEAQATKRVGVVFEIDHIVSWDHTKLGGAY